MIQQKKRHKCREVWRWKNGLSLVWNNCNICRQFIFKEKKNFIAREIEKKNFIANQTETKCDQNKIQDKYFLMIQQKKARQV